MLLFSANDGHGPVYKFPAYDYFKNALEPLLEEVGCQVTDVGSGPLAGKLAVSTLLIFYASRP